MYMKTPTPSRRGLRSTAQPRAFRRVVALVPLVCALFCGVPQARAVPASPALVEFTQPDGSTFRGRARGDEFFHWVETEDGCPVVRDAAGAWCYAARTATGAHEPTDKLVGRDPAPAGAWEPAEPPEALAAAKAPRTASLPLTPQGLQPLDGLAGLVEWKIPVLLGTFSDRTTGSVEPAGTTAQWDWLLFNLDTEALNSFSVRELYNEMSGGKVRVTSGPEGVKGWFVAPHEHDWYGGSKAGVNEESGHYFVRDIVTKADPTFNFGPYDTDNDGFVDIVAVIYQGTGEADSSNVTDIWPHQSELAGKGVWPFTGPIETNDRNAAGRLVKVNKYIIQNGEAPGGGRQKATIGTFCHELGHAAGLPDLYARGQGVRSKGVGAWSLMGTGGYNKISRSGDCPCWMDPWCRARLGWITPTEVTLNRKNYYLAAGTGNGSVLKVGGGPFEYFLIEMRAQRGFDFGLPGSGVMIWHIDETQGDWLGPLAGLAAPKNDNAWWPPENTLNGHMWVAAEQADGKYDIEKGANEGDATDPFGPGRSFTASSSPSSRRYNSFGVPGEGSDSRVSLTNFTRQSDATMSFDIAVNADVTPPDLQIVAPAEGAAGLVLDHMAFTSSESFHFISGVTVVIRHPKPGATLKWNAALEIWEDTDFPAENPATYQALTGEYRLDVPPAAFERGEEYVLVATIEDLSGNQTVLERKFILSDTVPPSLVIDTPEQDSENLPPVTVSGTATDDDVVAKKQLALLNKDLGKWYTWERPGGPPAGFSSATFSFTDHIRELAGPDSPWSTVLPAGLPQGHYQLSARAFDGAGNVCGWRSRQFILGKSPVVTVTEPGNNSINRGFPTLRGTAQDPGGAGLLGNQVQITIYHDGEYWNGSAWQTASASVAATVHDGTWEWTGTRPTRDGQMIVSVATEDTVGNKAKRIGPGLPGANSVIFTADGTKPAVRLDTPTAALPFLGRSGGAVTAPPLPADWISGLATDNLSRPNVTISLQRLSDGTYWTGSIWQATPSTAPGSYQSTTTSDGGSQVMWTWPHRLPALGAGPQCMTNGTYRITAVVEDRAGNTETTEREIEIDWNPLWLAPADIGKAPLADQHVQPIHGDTVASTVAHTFPAPGGGFRPTAAALGLDPAGAPITAAYLINPLASEADGSFRGLGAAPWQMEALNGDDPTNFVKAAVNSSGQTFAAYTVLAQTPFGGFRGTGATVYAKLDAVGNVLWRRTVSTGSTESDSLTSAGPAVLQPQADGSLLSLDQVRADFMAPPGSGFFHYTRLVHLSSAGAVLRQVAFKNPSTGEPGTGTSIVPRFLTAGAGHVCIGTEETDIGRFDPRQVIRRMDLATGDIVATLEVDRCETPETWHALTADTAGNLYQLSSFNAAPGDARVCVTKFDASLARQWRSFGPAHSGDEYGGIWVNHWLAPGKLHVGPQGITTIGHRPAPPAAGTGGEYPYSGLSFCRFTPDGALAWSRIVSSGQSGGFTQMSDQLDAAEVDATGAVLFLANLVEDAFAQTVRPVYGKVSSTGDVQFLKSLGGGAFLGGTLTVVDSAGRLVGLGYLPNTGELAVTVYDNPASVLVPVVLDSDSPADKTLLLGAPAEFTAINRGSPATYQWRKETGGVPQPIAGATGPTLPFASVQAGDAGRYSVVVTNTLGSRTSRTATLTVLVPVSLATALDTPAQAWTTGGDVPWTGHAPAPSHDGIDAAGSGVVTEFQESWIETTVTGPATISWWQKNDSTEIFDRLKLTDNGTFISQMNGGLDWRQATYNVPAGSHTLRWTYAPAAPGARAYLDQFVLPTTVSLADALDLPGATWTTSTVPWSGTTSPAHDGTDAGASGSIGNSASTWVQTTVTGPGTLSFWWKLSASFTDGLEFAVDGGRRGSLTGEADWSQVNNHPIDAGTHTLRWTYVKDSALVGGQDRAWLDQVAFTPSSGGLLYSGWLAQQGFSPAQIANLAISGPAANPDRDAFNNFLEYAFNTSPLAPGGAFYSSGVVTIGSQRWLVLRYRRWTDREQAGLTYTPQGSTTLASWITSGIIDEIDPEAPVLAGSTACRCRVPVGGGITMLRVLVAQ